MNFVDVSVDTAEGGRLVGPADWAVPIPNRARSMVSSSDRKLVVGFRPEHLEVGEPGGETGSFQARADVVEYLGSEELLHVSAADQDIVAIVSSEHRIRPGDVITLSVPLAKLHLFDGETGEALTTDKAAAGAPSTAAATAATPA